MAAMLMVIYFRGMNAEETVAVADAKSAKGRALAQFESVTP